MLLTAQTAPPYGHPLKCQEVLQPVQKVVYIAFEGPCPHDVLGQLVQLVDRSRVARLDVTGLVKLLLLDDDAAGQPKGRRPPGLRPAAMSVRTGRAAKLAVYTDPWW